ncbi:3' terminal RNA ribose 2'-O-methyltransferase Hen1 [Croceimicrobium hydrocarbonivorans]|uniref:Small RNA 2'-O-methyltransferase n=1 Tax=Croceimicrobium hydrocarbonivorans TaxID=2761580 RepID=A0A7H0VD11_9FLAO|nr:3' terminal RNA ribose 2'-O-methyltransferase Hen1 [Croceimicrobium hydrocarbonivorans]QNR23609.1 3' terminal RNA ribose 2'-O-methyltransferase Hen1 [Croceimicrobium hydrocarbonivorans]
MLLNISTTHKPATDLGFLLHKHPDKFQSFELTIGQAHVYYPESSEDRSTISLLLDIDPIDMVKKARRLNGAEFSLGQYVNDRPYVASSFMSVAIAKAFSSALNGKCKDKPELVEQALPLEVSLAVLPAAKGGEKLIKSLFGPLGYTLDIQNHALDSKFESWGKSKYFTLRLKHEIRLQDLLSHLYVLIPVLDNDKHYFVNQKEIDKLLERGKGWLETHPKKDLIISRYLFNLKSLTREALDRLDDDKSLESESEEIENPELNIKKENLHQQRLAAVVEQLRDSGAQSVIDLGCGEGKLLRLLLKEKQFQKITGMDVSYQSLSFAKEKLGWDEMAPAQKARINLFQGALTYEDQRLKNFDAAALVEVIEHLDENRLAALERVVFEKAQPQTVILTTPNAEYNSQYDSLDAGSMRHHDHRFEWTRAQFEEWAQKVALKNNYSVEFLPIGTEVENLGAPSQMGIFTYGN